MKFEYSVKKVRLNINLRAITAVLAAASFLHIFVYWSWYSMVQLALFFAYSAAFYLLLRKARRSIYYPKVETVPEPSAMEKAFDRFAKRLTNWIFIAYLTFFTLLMTIITLGINSKREETMAAFNGRLFFVQIIAFFVIKNALMLNWYVRFFKYAKARPLKQYLKKQISYSTAYWIAALVIFILFESIFVINTTNFFGYMYMIAMIAANLFFNKTFTYRSRLPYRPVMLSVCAVLLITGGYSYMSRNVWLTQPYINSIPNLRDDALTIHYNDETGVYTITKKEGDFRILQLTDIHLGGSVLSYDKDLKALKAVYQLIDETRPNLVIVTGDLVFPVGYASFSFNNTAPVQQFAAFMRNLGIPWAFTYGNHDTESYAFSSTHELNELYKSLSFKTSKTLLYPYIQPKITGRNNQLIELRNKDGTMNHVLFLIDSNAYTGAGLNEYDYIHDDQVEWYEKQVLRINQDEGRTVPSMVFFHIPLQEYKEAYDLYQAGSNEVVYYFGSNDERSKEKVCCSEYSSSLFETAVELGSTTGFFCGHDHYNNMSLEYKGIRLTYGMSIDYLAMPGIARDSKQRGGTLITVYDDGTSTIKQVPLHR